MRGWESWEGMRRLGELGRNEKAGRAGKE